MENQLKQDTAANQEALEAAAQEEVALDEAGQAKVAEEIAAADAFSLEKLEADIAQHDKEKAEAAQQATAEEKKRKEAARWPITKIAISTLEHVRRNLGKYVLAGAVLTGGAIGAKKISNHLEQNLAAEQAEKAEQAKKDQAETVKSEARAKILKPLTDDKEIEEILSGLEQIYVTSIKTGDATISGTEVLLYIANGSPAVTNDGVKQADAITKKNYKATTEQIKRAIKIYEIYSPRLNSNRKSDQSPLMKKALPYIIGHFLVPHLDLSNPTAKAFSDSAAELKIFAPNYADIIGVEVFKNDIINAGEINPQFAHEPGKGTKTNHTPFAVEFNPSTRAVTALLENAELFSDVKADTYVDSKYGQKEVEVSARDLILEGIANGKNYDDKAFVHALNSAFGKKPKMDNTELDQKVLEKMDTLAPSVLNRIPVRMVYNEIKLRRLKE